MVGAMLRVCALFPLVGLTLLACNDEPNERFLPLSEVCSFYAEEVCAAQARCCEGETPDAGGERDAESTCNARVLEACDDRLKELTSEGALSYDGKAGARVLDDLRAELGTCKDPSTLARFFEGGKARGAACKRNSECASFVCEDKACADAEVQPLCAF